jgi:hypothetical protein
MSALFLNSKLTVILPVGLPLPSEMGKLKSVSWSNPISKNEFKVTDPSPINTSPSNLFLSYATARNGWKAMV